MEVLSFLQDKISVMCGVIDGDGVQQIYSELFFCFFFAVVNYFPERVKQRKMWCFVQSGVNLPTSFETSQTKPTDKTDKGREVNASDE